MPSPGNSDPYGNDRTGLLKDMRQVRQPGARECRPQQQPAGQRAHSPIMQRPVNPPMHSSQQNRPLYAPPVSQQRQPNYSAQSSPAHRPLALTPNQPAVQQQRQSPSPTRPLQQPASYSNRSNQPSQQQQRAQQYPPPRPQLQVSITQPANPFVDPPRAAFVTPPSPQLSSAENRSASPNAFARTDSPTAASALSKADPDNDRLAPARVVGDQDFWKRFSMVAHEAEMEKLAEKGSQSKDPWLSKEFRGTRKFKIAVWTIALLCIGAIAGSLAWHFTHNSGSGVTQPTQHDFGLGGTSSAADRSGQAVGVGGGATGTLLAGASTGAALAVATSADSYLNLASPVLDDPTTVEEATSTLPTSTTRRVVASAAAVTTSRLATSTSALIEDEETTSARVRTTSIATARATIAKRLHRQRRGKQ